MARSASPASNNGDEGAGAEQPLLNTGEENRSSRQKSQMKQERWKQLGLLVWAILATTGVVAFGTIYQHERNRGHGRDESFPPKGKRNVVFMVSDGMGPTSLEITRSWRQFAEGLPYDDTLYLDKHLIGTSRTRSSNSLVTDSAAGATAFSCGKKSYNGAISVLPDHTPCGTVLEAAKRAGYMTGLVVTTRITDATPACFSAHVNYRSEEDLIAQQQVGENPLGRVVDLMLGGGRCHFLPQSVGEQSCRADDRDIVKLAKESFGFSYVDDRHGFDKLNLGKNVRLPLLGLFAKTDIPFEIDRKHDEYPALWEMAQTALVALQEATKNSDKGFFIMIEGSRIDHAGHSNDPAAQVREVLAYDKTFKKVLDWVEKSGEETVVVSTSDHETGGLAAARQLRESYPDYLWYPGVLHNATHSGEHLAAKLATYPSPKTSQEQKKLAGYIRSTILKQGLGITDASDEEIKKLEQAKDAAAYLLNDMVSRRAQIGWSTHGHSGVDVNIYGSGKVSRLVGNHENTDVGKFLRDYLQVDLEKVTRELRGVETEGWLGRSVWEAKNMSDYVVEGLGSYHGDFRKRSVGLGEGHEGCECGLRH